MAGFTLSSLPAGASVSVYRVKGGRVTGAVVTSGTVGASGELALTGLDPVTAYAAVTTDQTVQFMTAGQSEDQQGSAENPTYVATPDEVTLSVSSATDTPLGNKSLSMTGAAVALSTVSGGIPAGAKRFLFVPDVDVHYTDDGTATPSSTVGLPVGTGQAWVIAVADLSTVKFYGASGGTVRGGFYS